MCPTRSSLIFVLNPSPSNTLYSRLRALPNRLTGHFLTLCVTFVLIPINVWADDYDDVANLVRNGRQTEALQRIEQVTATRPRDPQMRFFRGMIEREMGQTSKSLATFLALTQDYPELPEPHNNLAVIYAAQNELDKALASLQSALRNNPNYATAHENLGDVYVRLAAAAYRNAQQFGPANPVLALKIANLTSNLTAPAQGTQK